MSAALAAAEPIAPMAMPISARRTGASFMPSRRPSSPFPALAGFGKQLFYLVLRQHLLRWSPEAFGHVLGNATSREHARSFTPIFFSSAMARLEVGFSTSDITDVAGVHALWRCVLWCLSCGSPCVTAYGASSTSPPAATSAPSTFAMTPLPLISCMPVTRSHFLAVGLLAGSC